jgi:hypothetical protein
MASSRSSSAVGKGVPSDASASRAASIDFASCEKKERRDQEGKQIRKDAIISGYPGRGWMRILSKLSTAIVSSWATHEFDESLGYVDSGWKTTLGLSRSQEGGPTTSPSRGLHPTGTTFRESGTRFE